MTIIKKGGIDYRVDDLVALLEDKIKNDDETEEEMNLYEDYQKMGPLVFGQAVHRPTVFRLMQEVDE